MERTMTGTKARSARAARRLAAARAAERRRRLWLLGGAVALAVIVAVGLIAVNRPMPVADELRIDDAAAPLGVPSTGRVMGAAEAPVHVVEYGDYQCPYCGTFAREAEARLREEYVATGKVRFEYRDLAFLGEESVRAAEAAACALDQGKFWQYHGTLFANQSGENRGAFADPRLRAIADGLGLDRATFDQCLADRSRLDEVVAMGDEARRLGIGSTPTLVVNGQVTPFFGYDELAELIERELRQ
jgi:protein-disulfide isomerase